jgi:hypothetical protein
MDWVAVETLGLRWEDNTKRQLAYRNCNLSNHKDDDDGYCNLQGIGQDTLANTGKQQKPVRPDYCREVDCNPLKDNDTQALKWLPMCSWNELAMELTSPQFRI